METFLDENEKKIPTLSEQLQNTIEKSKNMAKSIPVRHKYTFLASYRHFYKIRLAQTTFIGTNPINIF